MQDHGVCHYAIQYGFYGIYCPGVKLLGARLCRLPFSDTYHTANILVMAQPQLYVHNQFLLPTYKPSQICVFCRFLHLQYIQWVGSRVRICGSLGSYIVMHVGYENYAGGNRNLWNKQLSRFITNLFKIHYKIG